MPSRFSCVRQFATLWTVAQFPLCEDSPGKDTEVGCHALVQGIFLTRDGTHGVLAGGFFATSATWEAQFSAFSKPQTLLSALFTISLFFFLSIEVGSIFYENVPKQY